MEDNDIVKNEFIFNMFCESLAETLLQGSVLNKDEFSKIIKTHIKTNMEEFLNSLQSEIDYNYFRAKEKLQKFLDLYGMGHPQYVQQATELGKHKRKRTALIEIQRAKNIKLKKTTGEKLRLQTEQYERLKQLIIDNGHDLLLEKHILTEKNK